MRTMTRIAPSAEVVSRGNTVLPAGGPTPAVTATAVHATTATTTTAATAASCTAPAVGRTRVRQDAAERFLAPIHLPQHDGTILGIASPGRPES